MKKISVEKNLKTLNGQDLKDPQNPSNDLTVGKAIAMVLITHQGKKFDNFKLWNLSKIFHDSNGYVEIDDADFEILRQIVNEDKGFNALVLGQIIGELITSSEEKKLKSLS